MPTITRNTPLPPRRRRPPRYDFGRMKVGDVMIVTTRSGVQCAYHYSTAHPEYRFSTEQVGEHWEITRTG